MSFLSQNGGSFYTRAESEVLIDPFVSPPQMQSQLAGELARCEDLARRDFRYAHLVAGASKMPMNMIWVARNQGGDVNDQDLASLRDVAWTEFVKKRFLPSVAEGSSVAEAAASMLDIVRSMNLQRRRFQIMGLHEQVEASELQFIIHLCQAGLLHTGDYRVAANRFRRHDKFFEAFALAVGAFVCSSAPFTMGVATTQLNRSLQFEYKKQAIALFVYVLQENRGLVNHIVGFDEDYVSRIARLIVVSQEDDTAAAQLPGDEGGKSKSESFIRSALESIQRQADRVDRLAAQVERDVERDKGRGRDAGGGLDERRVLELIARNLERHPQIPGNGSRGMEEGAVRIMFEEYKRQIDEKMEHRQESIVEGHRKQIEAMKKSNDDAADFSRKSFSEMERISREISEKAAVNVVFIRKELDTQTKQLMDQIETSLSVYEEGVESEKKEMRGMKDEIHVTIDRKHRELLEQVMSHIDNRIRGITQVQPQVLGQALQFDVAAIKTEIASGISAPIHLRMNEVEKSLSENHNAANHYHQKIDTNLQLIVALSHKMDVLENDIHTIKAQQAGMDVYASRAELHGIHQLITTEIEEMREKVTKIEFDEENTKSDTRSDLGKFRENIVQMEKLQTEQAQTMEGMKPIIDNATLKNEILTELRERIAGLKTELEESNSKTDPAMRTMCTEIFDAKVDQFTSSVKESLKADVSADVLSHAEFQATVRKASEDFIKTPETMELLGARISTSREFVAIMQNRVSQTRDGETDRIIARVSAMERLLETQPSTAPNFNVFGAGGTPASAVYTAVAPP